MKDIIIIGAGPAGMTSALYLLRSNKSVAIIEKNSFGGKIALAHNVENYPGKMKMSGIEFSDELLEQITSAGCEFVYDEATSIEKKNDTFNIQCLGESVEGKTVIIAAGTKNRPLGVENEEKYVGKGISYCALCDGAFYKDKEVIVVGGASSALTESLYLSSICKKVTTIVRRDTFTGENYLVEKVLNTKNIKVIYNSIITSYNTKNDKLVSVTLDNKKKIKADGIFLAIGSTPNSELFDVEKENNYIITNKNYETNIKNVFAVGDVIKKDYYQLINASSEGMTAASTIIEREK